MRVDHQNMKESYFLLMAENSNLEFIFIIHAFDNSWGQLLIRPFLLANT